MIDLPRSPSQWTFVGRKSELVLALDAFAAGRAGLVVTGAKAGHLPLPGILGRLYAQTQAGLFRQFKSESRIVRHLDGASINDESIELLIKAAN